MLTKKRKIDVEGRILNDKWSDRFFFCEINGKPVCLICSQLVAVAKEYNIKRHYETSHAEEYDKYTGRLRTEKVNELAAALKKQQSTFTKGRETHDGAVKASYIIANNIAAASMPFCEGEFVKTCMLAAAELVCPVKRQAFANICLSRNTVAERIGDLAEDLNSQLKDKVKSFIAFSIAIAIDESTGVTDVAQLGIFIRGVDASLTITEEFVELVPMTNTTTANDIFSSLVESLDRLDVDWSRAVSVATDGAPSMVGEKAGVVAKLREKVQAENPEQELWHFHCIIHQKALCSKSWRMDNVMDVVVKTGNFTRLEKEFSLFRSPLTVDAADVPEELQMELIEIQCNSSLKYKFATVDLDSFYQCLGPMYPKMTAFASKILCMFGTTYLCEQAFSVMNINKSKLGSQLTHRHLNDIMKITTAQKLVPDVDKLVKAKRCQVSGSSN